MKKKLVTLLLFGVIATSFSGCGDDSQSAPKEKVESTDSNSKTESDVSDSTKITVTDFLSRPAFTSEQNTTAMVDEIAMVAKDNAQNMTDDQASEIIQAIRAADHKFYNGPEEMEKYMWYGYLLDYKYDDSNPRSSLGTDLCQAIKYVYRNAETVFDDSTKENLSQIDEDLSQIK